MNLRLYVFSIALLILMSVSQAQGPRNQGPGFGGGPNRSSANAPLDQPTSRAELSTLDQLLLLSDSELEELEATIRQIRRMSPQQRAAYRERIAQYQQLPAEKQQAIQSAWGHLSQDIKFAWRDYMVSLSDEERSAIRETMQALPPAERTQWRLDLLRSKGLLPPNTRE